MAKKIPASPSKSSSSNDHPLKLDEAWKKFPDGPPAERLDRSEDAFRSPHDDQNHSFKQTNHKTFTRQKKV